MVIGLTYDLRADYIKEGYSEEETAEFDRADTIDAIENSLNNLGYETDRIGNIKNLIRNLSKGKRWDLVFNICEGMYGIAREAQVPAVLEAYQIPYTFSDALTLALTLHKGLTKRVIRDLGIPTPNFEVVEFIEDIKKIKLNFPLFAKPVAEGTGKGISANSKIKNKIELNKLCKELLSKYKQPVIVETFLPGREFTVGIIGTGKKAKAIGVLEVILKSNAEKEVYSYINKEKCEELVEYLLRDEKIAKKCEETALKCWIGLGCRDAGRVDIRLDKNGIPNFLEVNPLAGLNPKHSDLPILCSHCGISYQQLIKKILDSTLKRVNEKDRRSFKI